MFKSRVVIVCLALCSALLAHAEPISYQGQLRDNGQLADGLFDFQFQLFDTQVGGSQVGVSQEATDLQVVDGVFRTELEFGDVYDDADLWLRIFVRLGGTGDAFTELLPRQRITSVPKAGYASVAETALDSFWVDAGNDTIRYGDGIQKVFINRTTPVIQSEYFSVHADTTGFGGMMMNTSTGGFPFYGYAEGDTLKAYTFYRHVNTTWNLWLTGGIVFEVSDQGDVSATGNIEADGDMQAGGTMQADGTMQASAYLLNAPRTLTYSVSGDVFHSGSNNAFLASDAVGGAYQAQAGGGWLMAPINLPNGAVVTAMHVTLLDNATGNMVVALQSRTSAGLLMEHASVTTTGASVAVQTLTDDAIVDSIIDNTFGGYHLRAFSSNWPGNLLLRIFLVRIEYTVDEAQ